MIGAEDRQMNWSKPRTAAPRQPAKRRHQTTVRWTPEEFRALGEVLPRGVTLSEFVRSRALGEALAPRKNQGT